MKVNISKTKPVWFIGGLSACRAVNTLSLGYTKESVNTLQGKSSCLF